MSGTSDSLDVSFLDRKRKNVPPLKFYVLRGHPACRNFLATQNSKATLSCDGQQEDGLLLRHHKTATTSPMNNLAINFSQDPRQAVEDSSPGPQTVEPSTNSSTSVQNHLNPLVRTLATNNNVQPVGAAIAGTPVDMTYQALVPDFPQYAIGTGFGSVPHYQQILQQASNTQPVQMSTQNLQEIQPNPAVEQQPLPGQQPQPQQEPQQQQTSVANSEYMRNYVNQKLPTPSVYEDQFRQRFLGAPAEPLLQAPMMDEARIYFGHNGNLPSFNRPSFLLPSPHELSFRDETRRMRGGVIEPFPEKLHRLLTEVEASGRVDVISFIASGKAFAIHKPDKFFKEIVPKYFRQSRLSSFKRQLNLYGFELINSGPARGGYYHKLFVKDNPELCRQMRRIAIKMNNSKLQEGKLKPQTDFPELQKGDASLMDPIGLLHDGVQKTDYQQTFQNESLAPL